MKDMEFVQHLLQKYQALDMPDSVKYKSPRFVRATDNDPVVQMQNGQFEDITYTKSDITVKRRNGGFAATQSFMSEDDDVFDGIDSNDEEEVEKGETHGTSRPVEKSTASETSNRMKNVNRPPNAHTKRAYKERTTGRHDTSIGRKPTTTATNQYTGQEVSHQKNNHLRKQGKQHKQRKLQKPLQHPPPSAKQQSKKTGRNSPAKLERPPQSPTRFKQGRSKPRIQRMEV